MEEDAGQLEGGKSPGCFGWANQRQFALQRRILITYHSHHQPLAADCRLLSLLSQFVQVDWGLSLCSGNATGKRQNFAFICCLVSDFFATEVRSEGCASSNCSQALSPKAKKYKRVCKRRGFQKAVKVEVSPPTPFLHESSE